MEHLNPQIKNNAEKTTLQNRIHGVEKNSLPQDTYDAPRQQIA
jgi:hypothetical protein